MPRPVHRHPSGECRSFPPLADAAVRVLVLGSMPGAESLRQQQYYAHPRNGFWPILGELLGFDPALPYAERTACLVAAGVALWDVLAACERPGSLDADIRQGQANDFLPFLRCHPHLHAVFFNGGTAFSLFQRQVWPTVSREFPGLELVRLPSTSPAHAGLSRDAKLNAWRQVAERAKTG